MNEVNKIPSIDNENGSMIPYVFGWLLGVPISVLFLIALLRGVF